MCTPLGGGRKAENFNKIPHDLGKMCTLPTNRRPGPESFYFSSLPYDSVIEGPAVHCFTLSLQEPIDAYYAIMHSMLLG